MNVTIQGNDLDSKFFCVMVRQPHESVHQTVRLMLSDIVTAFDTETIGSKVTNRNEYLKVLGPAILAHNFRKETVPGQAKITTPQAVLYTSSGVGQHTHNPSDYVLRTHRGRVGAYLKRGLAAPVTSCAAIVYTVQAYLDDPEITLYEQERIAKLNPTHVLVAVLASSGPPSPLTPWRFVANLSGRNHEAVVWDAETIRAKATEIVNYSETWGMVAD
jgi:hypothetical protein